MIGPGFAAAAFAQGLVLLVAATLIIGAAVGAAIVWLVV